MKTVIATSSVWLTSLLTRMIKAKRPFETITVTDNRVTLERLIHEKPGLVLMETNFYAAATAYMVARITARHRRLRIGMVGHESLSDTEKGRYFTAGAVGYVDFRKGEEHVMKCVDTLLNRNEDRFAEFIKLRDEARYEVTGPPALTPKEMEVLLLTCEGKSAEETGEALGLSSQGIRNYKTRIYEKSGVKNSVQLFHFAASMGWTDTKVRRFGQKPVEGGRHGNTD